MRCGNVSHLFLWINATAPQVFIVVICVGYLGTTALIREVRCSSNDNGYL